MNRKLLNCKDPILKKKSESVKKVDLEIEELCQEMIQIMKERQGIGLAAPQIGELKKVILVQTEEGLRFFINPEIIKKSRQTEIGEEGCLSIPNTRLNIKRAKKIEVQALDLENRKIKIETEGLTARIIQHEVDHLKGILITDRISFWQKIKSKINSK